MKSVFAALAMLVLLFSSLRAQSIELGEKEYLYQVLRNSYDVQAIRNNYLATLQKENQSKALYNPEAYLNAGHTGSTNAPSGLLNSLQANSLAIGVQKLFFTGTVASMELGGEKSTSGLAFDFATSTPNVEKTSYAPYLTINVVQPVLKGGLPYLPGRILLDINRNIKDTGVLGSRMALQSLVLGALLQYHQFLTDLAILNINRESLQDFQALYARYERQLSFGAIKQTDLLRFRSQVQELELSVMRSEMKIYQDLAALGQALKTNLVFSELQITESFLPGAVSNTLESAYQRALSNGVEMLQTRVLLDNNRLNYLSALDSSLPELNLSAGYTLKGNSDGGSWGQAFENMKFNEYFVGLEFRMPFLTQSEKARVLEARYQKQKAEAEYQSSQEQLYLDIMEKIRQLEFQLLALERYQQLQLVNQRIVKEAVREYANGEISSRDLVSANEDLRRAKTTYALELFRYKALALELELSKGDLLGLYGIEVSDWMK